ncbi:MAG: sulfatase-like hydrolase/transferase [Pirellulales bacterium]
MVTRSGFKRRRWRRREGGGLRDRAFRQVASRRFARPRCADPCRRSASPGAFGFDEWVSVTNFFDRDPLMLRGGRIEEFQGDSSEIAVAEASKFLERHREQGKPLFAVVWFGSPHSPFQASPEDRKQFAQLDAGSANHYGELVALDRAVGALCNKLRELKLADDTLLVFCSDNGGLGGIEPKTVGELRGNKGNVYEGGLRVPGIIEWPAVIRPRVTDYPASTMDLFPTVVDVLNLPADVLTQPVDGISLRPLFTKEIARREKPIPFRYQGQAAWIDNQYKLLSPSLKQGQFELYDLASDPSETKDLAETKPEVFERLHGEFTAWNESVERSFAGKDYPEGRVEPADPKPISWTESPAYQPYLDTWRKRPEYRRSTGRTE